MARIGVAIGVASVAGYALLALVGRALAPAQFGLFVAFWGVLFGLGSSLSTIEQDNARRAASEAGSGEGGEPGPPAPAVTAAAAVLAALAAATTLLPPVAERLYGQANSRLGLVVVVAALGFAVQFAVRGVLIGSGQVRAYAGLVVAEAVARLVPLLAILAFGRLALDSSAIAVAIGSFAWVGWSQRARHVLPRLGLSLATWRAAVGRAGSLMVAAALAASVITGFPTLVTALNGHAPGAAGGAVFAALTVSRVPLLLVSPLQAVAVPFVVRVQEAPNGASTVRKGLVLGSVFFVVLGTAAAAVAWVLGRWIVQLVYGNSYDVPAVAIALLVFSACLLAWVQLLSATLIALASHRGMLTLWAVAVIATIIWLLASPLGVVATTAIGALVGPLGALACGIPMIWWLSDPGRSHLRRPGPALNQPPPEPTI